MSPKNRLPPANDANKKGTSQDIKDIGVEYPLHAIKILCIFFKKTFMNAQKPPIYYKHTSKKLKFCKKMLQKISQKNTKRYDI